METKKLHCVTGAFGYSGKYIAKLLLEKGMDVITLTNSPNRPEPFQGRVKAHPFNFDNPQKLMKSLEGVKVLYNTYWVRFNHATFTHNEAVLNTRILFEAARKAGVERIVHVSITNPEKGSSLEYFRDKAVLEESLKASGLSYSILRVAVLFGKEDILINNIAWTLRTFPVFGIFGDGMYKIEPIYVNDLAELAVEEGEGRENRTIDAVGPESFTFRKLVETIGEIIGKKRPIMPIPPFIGGKISSIIGYFVNDVILTEEEIEGLMAGLLYTGSKPLGKTRLSEWTKKNSASLGVKYASELARRMDREKAYIDA